jgi:hypothetical protein
VAAIAAEPYIHRPISGKMKQAAIIALPIRSFACKNAQSEL